MVEALSTEGLLQALGYHQPRHASRTVLHSNLEQYRPILITDYPISFGEKWLQISSANVFGSNHSSLAIAYLAAAGVSAVLMIMFLVICAKEKVEMAAKRR